MDKNLSTTPKAKPKARRVPLTPETGNTLNINVSTSTRYASRHKSTASMHDLSLNVSSVSEVRKKFGGSRTSLAPSSSINFSGLKKFEADNADTELGLLYDDYLQTLMSEVLLKKKAIEKEKKILNQLASISKEQDLGNEKLMKMKGRKKDIRYLSALQNTLDVLVTEIRTNFEDLNNFAVKEGLEKLKIQLEPFDFLRCQGIELPVTPDEHQKFQKVLNHCCKSLQEVSDMLKENCENLQKIKSEFKEFIETQKQIESIQKNLQSTMLSLQKLILKKASQSFSETILRNFTHNK